MIEQQKYSSFIYNLEKFGFGVFFPIAFWLINVVLLISLICTGYPLYKEATTKYFGKPVLLAIPLYAKTCYYRFAITLVISCAILVPMIMFRIKMLKKLARTRQHTHAIGVLWFISIASLQFMAWTNGNISQLGLHPYVQGGSGILFFTTMILAQLIDQILVIQIMDFNNASEIAESVISLIFLGLGLLLWGSYYMYNYAFCQWLGLVFVISAILFWIPQNLRFYDKEPPAIYVEESTYDELPTVSVDEDDAADSFRCDYAMDKWWFGVSFPILLFLTFNVFLIYLVIIGWPAYQEKTTKWFGSPRLLDISVYAWLCYYEFGGMFVLCAILSIPMVFFRIKMLRKFGVSQKNRYIIVILWVISMCFLQVMAWTNSVYFVVHFLSAVVGFAFLVAAQMMDQIMVLNMENLDDRSPKINAVMSLALLGFAMSCWICWILLNLTIGEWVGTFVIISALLIWIPQNVRFYNQKNPSQINVENMYEPEPTKTGSFYPTGATFDTGCF